MPRTKPPASVNRTQIYLPFRKGLPRLREGCSVNEQTPRRNRGSSGAFSLMRTGLKACGLFFFFLYRVVFALVSLLALAGDLFARSCELLAEDITQGNRPLHWAL